MATGQEKGQNLQKALEKPEVQDALGKAGVDKQNPDVDKLMQALAAQQQATGLLQKASALKDKAMKCLNPVERKKMLQEAYDKEVEANGQSVWARRMQSGVWQVGGAGAGIGGGLGMGLGAVVGSVVGGVVSLPTTALGGLVGAGVGGITGPIIKLDQTKAKQVAEREKKKGKSPEEIEKAVREEAVAEDQGDQGDQGPNEGTLEAEDVEGLANSASPAPQDHNAAISQPEAGSAQHNLQRQHSTGATSQQATTPSGVEPDKPKKKPRKIEVRSGKKSSGETQ
ncbi:hypothetical protein KC318_g201 [Hortaea werneckii]|nr:hypothetical protein KC334_g13488 [Hortaea werneckii]KAI7027486.1 hypothetical protein KC355_g312 [Hortaea werneckii]KAI7676551.1 hypothetical protein KC318_g201 [Hortaea werneckii]